MIKKEIYEQVLVENNELKTLLQRKEERIAYLERLLYGAKRDKLAQQGPTLFDELFEKALDEKQSTLEEVAKDVDKEATSRREKRKQEPSRPAKYRYVGLPEEWREEYPEGINLADYDIIGANEDRILHRTEARVWVECIKRPILRLKSEKNALQTNIIQAPSPRPIIGGNHVAADFLARLILDKYVYHIPEYRQVKIYSDLGVKLPTSTINNWVHAVANKLYPLYETLCEEILRSGYLQIDEVPWRIADRIGQSCRKGYAWQFRDVDIGGKGTFFYYHKGSRAGEIPRSQLKRFKGTIQTDGYEKAPRSLQEAIPKRENAPSDCRGVFQNGNSFLQTAGAFSKTGMASCRLQGHFPEREWLPAVCMGIFQIWNGFLQTAGK